MRITCTIAVPYIGAYNSPWTRDDVSPGLLADMLARGVPVDAIIIHDAPAEAIIIHDAPAEATVAPVEAIAAATPPRRPRRGPKPA